MKTLIRAETLIAYQQGEHRLLPEGELVFEDDSIIFVGRNYPEPVDRILDASSQLVIPGLINLHFHATTEAGGRLIVDQGRKDFFQTGYLNYLTAPPDKVPLGARETATVGGLFALVELIHSGCTTLVEFGAGSDELVEIAGGLGVRAYLGPGYQSAFQRLSPQGHLYYEWDHERGQQGLEQAVRFVHKHQGSYSDRIRCLLSPWQADTVDPELLKQTCQASDDLGVGIQIHTGQNLVEFHEILRRTGLTPVEYLHQQGMLKPGTLLSHCLLTSAHPLAGIPASDDLSILADTGASIAHCPLVFARRGNALFSFHQYRQRGLSLGLGTDTYPRDLIGEMRLAALICKVIERDFGVATAAEIFEAATLGGARALRREDLGRLCPGAKADIVCVDLHQLRIGPYRDPLQALINCAQAQDVRTVIVDGQVILSGGQVKGIDEEELLVRAQIEAERLWASVPEWHWQGISTQEFAPLSLPLWEEESRR